MSDVDNQKGFISREQILLLFYYFIKWGKQKQYRGKLLIVEAAQTPEAWSMAQKWTF